MSLRRAWITIYHNPRCSKSRQALAMLREHDREPETVLYPTRPSSTADLLELIEILGIEPRELLRGHKRECRTLGPGDPTLESARLIEAMAAHPRLIQRPVADKGKLGIIARPPEKVLDLL